MKKWLWILPAVCLAAAAWADLQVTTPKDKLITFDQIVDLQGKAPTPAVKVNNVALPSITGQEFSCGLVLKRGKNLVAVRSGQDETKIRVLRLITYPDIEQEYEGKKHWARAQIVYLSALGMIEGYPDGEFHPGIPVTRGEFSTWLAKAKKLPIQENLTADPFFDVPKEHWRSPYVKAVAAAGYIPPYSSVTFGLDDPISRREAADLVVKTEGLGIISKVIPIFRDVPKEEKGAVPIYTAKEGGLIIGVSPDIPVYDPDRALTRAEAAVIISRFAVAQNGIRYLYSFETGYTEDNFCRLNVVPEIGNIAVEPQMIKLNQKTTVKLRVRIGSRQNFSPISKVKVDLTEIGGLPDTELFDDGDYSLNFSVTPKKKGTAVLRVKATDQLGWEGEGEAALTVQP